jgi:hypothetical protein
LKPRTGPQQVKLTRPKTQGINTRPHLSFGFRYFRQIDKFGLSGQAASWLVSLLQRLSDLSAERWDDLVENPTRAQALRFHPIDWDAKNIPVARKDLNWLPSDYLDDAGEYPFYQFQVSRSLGRFAGFRDESGTFQIVLIDPLHNLQPSGDFDYRVRPSNPLKSDYDVLRASVDGTLQKAKCVRNDCDVLVQLQAHQIDDYDVLLLRMEGSDRLVANQMIQDNKCTSMYQIFQDGLVKSMVSDE